MGDLLVVLAALDIYRVTLSRTSHISSALDIQGARQPTSRYAALFTGNASDEPPVEKNTASLRILLVDDEPNVLRALKRLFAITGGSLALLVAVLPAHAAGTASGTPISNSATLTYSIGGVGQPNITTAAATFLVDNKVNVTVAETGGSLTTAGVVAGAVGVITTFTVTNTGNTVQDYVLAVNSAVPNGQILFGGTDNFDVTGCTRFVESGTTVGYQVLEDTATFIDELAADASKTVYVLCSVPIAQINGDVSLVSLLATTYNGGTPAVQGALTTQDLGPDVPGTVQVVFADANAADPQGDNAARNGQHSARDGYWLYTPVRSVAYNLTTFVEATANDGSITTVSTLTLTNDTYTGAVGAALTGGVVTNVPPGLTAVLIKTSATTATLSLTGNATAHASANDIANLTVTLGNATFTLGNAAGVTGAIKNDLVVNFIDMAVVNLTKTVIHIQDPSGCSAAHALPSAPSGCKIVPGSILTYRINLPVTGSGNVDSLILTDPIPANMTYVPGSIVVNGAPKTDAADIDKADFNTSTNTVTVRQDTVTATTPFSFTFRATIN